MGLGAIGLAAVLAGAFLLAAGAAGAPSQYVPARHGGWPGWLAGPFGGIGLTLTSASFEAWILLMCAGYAAVLAGARSLPLRWLWAGIVAAHLILALGPPLLSQDVFGYLSFARLGALHGLDPYTHAATEAPGDPVFAFLGRQATLPPTSPYGALFTLASYALAPLGLAGGVWTFKAIVAISSVGAVALLARAAGRLGASAAGAAAFVGLNPALLALAVATAHIDTLVMLTLAAALALDAGARPRFRSSALALVAGAGIKLSAGLPLPFLLLAPGRARERVRTALVAAAGLLALAAIGLIGFGVHAFGFLTAIGEQQKLVAAHGVPAETARLFGLDGTPWWWRDIYAAAFVLVLLVALWRTARGADWRVAAGWSTIALLLCTAWLLPWYAIWPLPLAAVSRNARLRAATLVFCAYALLIHLALADPLLSPPRPLPARHLHLALPAIGHRIELTGFQVMRDVQLDLGW